MALTDPEPVAVSRGPSTAWAGVQRRVRLLVPAPIRRADLAVFRAVARTEIPVVGPLLPRLSRAANHSRLWMVLAAGSAAFGGRFGRRAAARGLLAVGATSALTNLPAKLLTGRARPDLSLVPEVRRLARVPSSTSFPSGHSASAFAFAAGACLEEPRLRLPLFALATAVATSRVYTGVHYPGDALVGSLIGVAVARATTRPWPLADQRPATAAPAPGDASLIGPRGEGLVVVRNVAAGPAYVSAPEGRVRDEFPAARLVDVEPGDGLISTLREAASGARVLCIAGGNGSISAAAAVAHEADVPLAIIASGTLNHLAKDLGVQEAETTIRALRGGEAIAVDLGAFGDRVFVNAASIGAYPHLVVARERLERTIGKWPAALWGVLRSLRTARPTRLEIDGEPRQVWLLFIGNCHYEEAGVPATRRLRLDDGTLDVRVLDADPPWARTRIALALLFGRVDRSPAYQRWSATEVRVRAEDGPVRIVADGEAWTTDDELVVRKRPRSLVVYQPAE